MAETDHTNDEHLVSSLKRGDEAAFKAFYNLHRCRFT